MFTCWRRLLRFAHEPATISPLSARGDRCLLGDGRSRTALVGGSWRGHRSVAGLRSSLCRFDPARPEVLARDRPRQASDLCDRRLRSSLLGRDGDCAWHHGRCRASHLAAEPNPETRSAPQQHAGHAVAHRWGSRARRRDIRKCWNPGAAWVRYGCSAGVGGRPELVLRLCRGSPGVRSSDPVVVAGAKNRLVAATIAAPGLVRRREHACCSLSLPVAFTARSSRLASVPVPGLGVRQLPGPGNEPRSFVRLRRGDCRRHHGAGSALAWRPVHPGTHSADAAVRRHDRRHHSSSRRRHRGASEHRGGGKIGRHRPLVARSDDQL